MAECSHPVETTHCIALAQLAGHVRFERRRRVVTGTLHGCDSHVSILHDSVESESPRASRGGLPSGRCRGGCPPTGVQREGDVKSRCNSGWLQLPVAIGEVPVRPERIRVTMGGTNSRPSAPGHPYRAPPAFPHSLYSVSSHQSDPLRVSLARRATVTLTPGASPCSLPRHLCLAFDRAHPQPQSMWGVCATRWCPPRPRSSS